MSTTGIAKLHEFANGDHVFNVKLKADELQNVPTVKGFKNICLVKEGENITVVPNSFYSESHTPVKNSILNISLQEKMLGDLKVNNNNEIDFSAAIKKSSGNEKFNEYVIYQKSDDKNIYFGNGQALANRNVGLGYFNKSEENEFGFVNLMINKNELLSLIPSKGNVVDLNLVPTDKENTFKILQSNEMNKSNAVYSYSINMDKANICIEDGRGFINLSSGAKKAESILDDRSDMTLYESTKGKAAGEPKLYVGKGFSANMIKERDQSINENLTVNNTKNQDDHSINVNDVVSFKVNNDYYMNTNFGIKDHQAVGTVKEINHDVASIDSPCGNFSIKSSDLVKSSQSSLDTFTQLYSNLKELKKIQKLSNSKELGNEEKKNSPAKSSKTDVEKVVDKPKPSKSPKKSQEMGM